jgi:peptide deformylase
VIHKILRHGAEALHHPSALVTNFTLEIQSLIDDMVQTMYSADGIGLAAPQIGVALRIFVVDLSVGKNIDDLITFVNPILTKEEGTQLEEEGCLSLPGFNSKIIRPEKATVTGLNREGDSHTIESAGLLARAFQHEIDHLDGKLFVDRLKGLEKSLILRRVKKLSRTGKW